MYYLDSNVIIDATSKRTSNQIRPHFEKHKPEEIALPAIILAELEYGARHSNDYENNIRIVLEFIAPFKIIPFTQKEAVAYGKIREQLAKEGKIIGPNDLLVAATALANGATIVTHNIDEFSRVNGLNIEDWREA